MTPAQASEYLKIIPKYSDQVCFTGGEPLLYYNEILPLIRQAKELGLKATLVTGGGWVSQKKPEIARERMMGLKEAGLDTLLVSWDDYHEEFSPAENALLLVEICKEIGLPNFVRGVMSAFGPNPRIEQKLVNIDVNYQKVSVLRLGTAATLPEEHFTFKAFAGKGGCSTALQAVIEPDGNVYACCGPARFAKKPSSPLVLGNTADEDLDSILHRAVRDPLVEAISSIGPYGLFQLIKDEPSLRGLLPVRDRYTGICELCLDMNDVPAVVQRIRERLDDDGVRMAIAAAHLYSQTSPELRALTPSPM
ncbi:MoaA/NifB/PqqE/SkfB family radical SAM enzyme [Granulicella arctica]|uniref:MoaA/NifB/PqqE/SkfB family radical SAM enzyme n=2 Tax=Granulicella arctica TaxID=940613 RepID=A0A7Y9PEG1_9BACT|nr:MoaA/NifB/PqqE/SkfB family radical SAM enzyme [Granulicella arctica]